MNGIIETTMMGNVIQSYHHEEFKDLSNVCEKTACVLGGFKDGNENR